MKTGSPAWIRGARFPDWGADARRGAIEEIQIIPSLRNTHLTKNFNENIKDALTPNLESMTMKIEKSIPMRDARGAKPKYPWREMEVGDSFYADISPDILRVAARKFGQRNGMAFKVRKDGAGARAWRV